MAKFIKIIVCVPVPDAPKLREALGRAGAGQIGRYHFGSFSTRGIGRGIALDGANPAKGEIGKLEEVEEEQIETTCKAEQLNEIIKVIKAIHPYEEPVITLTKVQIV